MLEDGADIAARHAAAHAVGQSAIEDGRTEGDLAFKIDFRFWIVALKLMSAKQFLIFLIYLIPFTAFFVVALHVLHRNFSTMSAPRGALYLTNILALTLGFIVLLVLQYGTMWLTGKLFNPLPDPGFVPPLSSIHCAAAFIVRGPGKSASPRNQPRLLS